MSTLSLSKLAARVAETADAHERKSVARQISHWTDSGLFKMIGIKLDDPHVGRGGVRRYPLEVTPWVVLMYELARIGLSVISIMQVVTWVRLHELAGETYGHTDLFAQAIAGGDTPILLKVIFMRHSGPDRPRIQTVKVELIEGSSTIDGTLGSCAMINLTRVMERIRPFLNEGGETNVYPSG